MNLDNAVLRLLARLAEERVEYVLVGGQAVRINGFVRATEDVDLLLKAGRENGERIKRALDFLESAHELDPAWFESQGESPENIRVADDIVVDLLFAANGETYDTMRAFVKTLEIDGVMVRVLNVEGLLRTKTNFREKDLLDRSMLEKIRRGLQSS
jgi:hypothetical protein